MAEDEVVILPFNDTNIAPITVVINETSPANVVNELWKVVSALDVPKAFAYSSQLPTILPGLQIKGYGEVGFPFRELEAERIISLCQQNPLITNGSPDTELDSATRHIGPSAVSLVNDEFEQQINSLAVTVAEELGLGPVTNFTVQLNGVLIHGMGGTFSSIKDPNSANRVFASLVVTLPSIFEGGGFMVSHQGMRKIFKTEKPAYRTSYIAFYNSCAYNFLPVASGHRLSLVYDVVSVDPSAPIPAPPNTEPIVKAREYLQRWSNSAGTSPFVAAFILEHTYKSDGAGFQDLKGSDKAMARVLQEAVLDTTVELFVAQFNHNRYTSNGGSYLKPDHTENIIKSLRRADASRVDVNIRIDETAHDEYPDSESDDEVDGWTNEQHRYNRSALVLIRKEKFIDLLANGDEKSATSYLVSMVSTCLPSSRDRPEWQDCAKLARLILEKNSRAKLTVSLLDTLLAIDDPQLVLKYLSTAHFTYEERGNAKTLFSLIQRCWAKYGWVTLGSAFYPLLNHSGFFEDLQMALIKCIPMAVKTEDPIAFEIVQGALRQLIQLQESRIRLLGLGFGTVMDTEPMSLIRLACSVDPTLLGYVMQIFASGSRDAVKVVPGLQELMKRLPEITTAPEFTGFITNTIIALQGHISRLIAQPNNEWAIYANVRCQCMDCVPLAHFLQDPVSTIYRLRAVGHRRNHAENSCSGVHRKEKLLAITTDKSTSPQSLVITKICKGSDLMQQDVAELQHIILDLEALLVASRGGDEERPVKKQKIVHIKLE